MPIRRIGVPAAISSAPIEPQTTRAVPMSGWVISTAQAAPTTSSSGRARVPIVRTDFGRSARMCTA